MPQIETNQFKTDDCLKQALSTAMYYGFMPVDRVIKEANKKTKPSLKKRKPAINRSAFDRHHGKLHSAFQTYVDNKFDKLSNPVLFYHTDTNKKDDTMLLTLQAMGTHKSIGEALLIKTSLDILEDLGITNTCVHINTTGDRDSTTKYYKELQAFFRKHVGNIPPAAQSALKKDAFQCLAYLYKKDHPLYREAPQSLEFLSEPSRKHMRELLEYFETVDIPYIFDKSLVSSDNYYPRTAFEIRDMCDDDYDPTKCSDVQVHARGYRYDDLSRKMFRNDIPAVSITFEFKKKNKSHEKLLSPKSVRRPKIHFIQFGFDAKLKSLIVIDQLRKAKIPIHQSLGNDRLSRQLEIAEELNIPHTIIMGQKEVMDDTVIIRNMKTRSQEIIPVESLPEHLKTLK